MTALLTIFLNLAFPTQNLLNLSCLQSPWAKVFPSEEVTLKCNIQPSSNDWSYDWYKDGLKQTRTIKNQFKIKSVDQSNNGSYTCRGIHKRQVITAHSSGITVYVYGKVWFLLQYSIY